MDPQQNSNTVEQNSVSPETPTAIPTPVQTPSAASIGEMPVGYPAQPTPISTPPGTGKASKKGLFGVIAGAIIIVVAAALLSWFMYFSPAAQSKRLSNNFMHSITTGDVAKATDLTGDSTAKDFLTTASKNVHGSYKLSQSKFTNSKGYYLYTLSGADKKYARTIIEKDNGKRVVNSFVFSNSTLALMPNASTSVDSSTADTSTSAEQNDTNTSACLTPSDFSFFSNVGFDKPNDNGDGTYSVFFQLEFNPDVATYSADGSVDPSTVFGDLKNFYAQNANKQYVIELEASVNSSSPDTQLANSRNSKVQSDLETISGIPASKITIQPNTNDTSGQGDAAGDSFNRQVQITLRSADSCSVDN